MVIVIIVLRRNIAAYFIRSGTGVCGRRCVIIRRRTGRSIAWRRGGSCRIIAYSIIAYSIITYSIITCSVTGITACSVASIIVCWICCRIGFIAADCITGAVACRYGIIDGRIIIVAGGIYSIGSHIIGSRAAGCAVYLRDISLNGNFERSVCFRLSDIGIAACGSCGAVFSDTECQIVLNYCRDIVAISALDIAVGLAYASGSKSTPLVRPS